jgi:hypothetical protein
MPEFHCRYRSQKANFVGELMKKKYLYPLVNQLHLQKKLKSISFLNIALSQRPTPSSVGRFQALTIWLNKGQTLLFAPCHS